MRARASVVAIVIGLAAASSLTGCSETAGADTDGGGSAACAQPATAASAQVVSPGDTVTITTRDLFDDCDDDGRPNTQMPRRDLAVTWVQGATTIDLGTGDADEAGVLTRVITVPRDAEEGTATIEVEGAVPAEVEVQS